MRGTRGTIEDSLLATTIRRLALLMAALMVCAGAWLMLPDVLKEAEWLYGRFLRPRGDPNRLLKTAATVGLVRGDLWADYAETFAILDGPTASCELKTTEAADAATKSLTHSPHNARVWLILAAAQQRCAPNMAKTAGAMRMSFYTGANEIALIRNRLRLALESPQIKEPEFRRLVFHDIQTAIVNRPDLTPAAIEIYRNASPAGRELLRQAASEFAPRFDFRD